jgi:hypothetical protein
MTHSTRDNSAFDSWVLFPWFDEHGASHIHPEDIDRFKNLPLGPKVFGVLGTLDDFTEIAYGSEVFRVKSSLLRPVPAPSFFIGQKVRVPGKNEEAVVERILWHDKEDSPFFIVRVGGKLKSKQYWAEDLLEA